MILLEILKMFFIELFTFEKLELFIILLFTGPTLYAMLSGAPFVPTQMKQVNRMLSAVPLKSGMKLYDLGSGDGRLVYKANKDYGVKSIGYEFSPFVWMLSKLLQKTLWRSKAQLIYGNFWDKDLSDADVIVCYLLPSSMKKMKEKIFPKLRQGTLIISHAFSIPDLKAIKILEGDSAQKLGPVYVYSISLKSKPKSNSKTKKR